MQRCHNYKINCGVKISKEQKKRLMSTKKNYCENAKKKKSRVRGGGISLDVYKELRGVRGGGGGRGGLDGCVHKGIVKY